MRSRVSLERAHYYLAFSYPWYARMRDGDLSGDLKAYLDSLEPVFNRTPEHDLTFSMGLRPLVGGWKQLEFERDAMPEFENPTPEQRGAYLVEALGHCGACHTPRNILGFYDDDRHLGGNDRLPGDAAAPKSPPMSAKALENGRGTKSPACCARASVPTEAPSKARWRRWSPTA